jgi:hypothetical protein
VALEELLKEELDNRSLEETNQLLTQSLVASKQVTQDLTLAKVKMVANSIHKVFSSHHPKSKTMKFKTLSFIKEVAENEHN